eukprot:1212525-Pleurochrysis_carterae.AAC.1
MSHFLSASHNTRNRRACAIAYARTHIHAPTQTRTDIRASRVRAHTLARSRASAHARAHACWHGRTQTRKRAYKHARESIFALIHTQAQLTF